ncbi:uncharacterized protein LOC128722625 [Anopheles nili]|uniref:uncharacterized protein LOC128722625 n=1 Tax=Anopheles nili TaxID=185578 RepID=UPI00237A61B2|nr:uncharacterized protein LOC128722625 [Anopheles nili]
MCNCCKCIFSCWEDFYWNCIEEKFCFDETLVNYDPDEDEHVAKNKNKNGFYGNIGDSAENNNAPICRQPSGAGIGRNMSNISSKIHEDDLRREIQTNVPMLAPEVMAIFANSQIFQSSAPPKQPTSKATSPTSVKFAISDSGSPIEVTPPTVTGKRSVDEPPVTDDAGGRELSSDKLLQRLEGSISDERDSRKVVIPAIVEEEDGSDDQSQEGEVVLRPPRNFSELSLSKSLVSNKTLSHLQAELPYFSIRPASENDIFTISSGVGGGVGGGAGGGVGAAGGSTYNSISMTPEVPAISYSNLPKNYLETPVIEKYRESVSLYSIQTAGINRQSQTDDLSMPRYYGKSDLFVAGIDRANSRSVDAVERGQSDDGGSSGSLSLSSGSLAKGRSRNVERSKRLMNLRTALPPLNLGLIRGSSASNLRDRREDRESKERDKSAKSKEGLRV